MGWMPLPSPPNIQVTLIVSKVVFNSVLCLCSDTSNVPLCFLWYFLPSSYKDLTCRTCMLSHFSCVQFFVTPWTVAHQAPLSMGFSRQKKWSGLPYLLPGDFPNPGVKPMSLTSPALAGGFFTTSTTWEVPSKKKKQLDVWRTFSSLYKSNMVEVKRSGGGGAHAVDRSMGLAILLKSQCRLWLGIFGAQLQAVHFYQARGEAQSLRQHSDPQIALWVLRGELPTCRVPRWGKWWGEGKAEDQFPRLSSPTGMATWERQGTTSPCQLEREHSSPIQGEGGRGSSGRKSKNTLQAVCATQGKRNWPFSHGEVHLLCPKPQAHNQTSSSEVPAMTTGRGPASSGPHPSEFPPYWLGWPLLLPCWRTQASHTGASPAGLPLPTWCL